MDVFLKLGRLQKNFRKALKPLVRKYGAGTAIVFIGTLVYFAPLLPRLDSYSSGGDALFNAWTLARNHHCLKGYCESYVDGNIYFPNNDSMLYSETQLSTGVLTLPLHFINDNPLFAYNVWKITSTFFAAWFMYLLAKKLSHGHEAMSVLSGFIFAFAPFKISALGHLQNLSIFYLPITLLLLICYLERPRRRYLLGFFASLVLLFHASWYQMVFSLTALGVLLLGIGLSKITPWKKLVPLVLAVAIAALSTAPLALEYARFSKSNSAGFTIGAQTSYSSSIADYLIPDTGTMEGRLYNALAPESARRRPYNLDSRSYHGIILYALAVLVLVVAFRRRKASRADRNFYKWAKVWAMIGAVGFLFSLGPLLKVGGSYIYATLDNGTSLSVPLPYLLIDVLFPPIQFIRAVGRWSVLVLLTLCIMVALLPHIVQKVPKLKRHRLWFYGIFILFCVFELAPLHLDYMAKRSYAYNIEIPNVYRHIKSDSKVNNLLVLRSDEDYPKPEIVFARVEDVMWAGYHNKNIFNGYSGYTPPDYEKTYKDFQKLEESDIAEMKMLGLQHILVDKRLSLSNLELSNTAKRLAKTIYEDERFVLLKLP